MFYVYDLSFSPFSFLYLGQRAIYVDGAPISVGAKSKLSNNAVVEIAGLRFIFLINSDLINIVRAEAAKSL